VNGVLLGKPVELDDDPTTYQWDDSVLPNGEVQQLQVDKCLCQKHHQIVETPLKNDGCLDTLQAIRLHLLSMIQQT
jgi:hypothetical protein